MPTAPAPEKEPPVQYPSCPGCPTPEEAAQKEGSCGGPQKVEFLSGLGGTCTDGCINICEVPENEIIIMCPKTQKSITR